MEYTTLGESDVEVSAVTMGLWNIAEGNVWDGATREEGIEAIETAVEAGITSFDTAEGYGKGQSEEILGDALEDQDREDLTIATKVSSGNHRAADLKEACRASLDRLDTDYLDLYYLHWPNEEVPFEETFGALADLREEGLIREAGVSNFGAEQLAEAREASPVPIVANQVPYSPLWRAIEFGIAEATVNRDASVAAYSPLAQGLLTGAYDDPDEVPDGINNTRLFSSDRAGTRHGGPGEEDLAFETIERVREICSETPYSMPQVALAWLLDREGVDTVIAGSTSPEHVRANAEAGSINLDPDVARRIEAATEDLKIALGPNPDPWQSDSRYR